MGGMGGVVVGGVSEKTKDGVDAAVEKDVGDEEDIGSVAVLVSIGLGASGKVVDGLKEACC